MHKIGKAYLFTNVRAGLGSDYFLANLERSRRPTCDRAAFKGKKNSEVSWSKQVGRC